MKKNFKKLIVLWIAVILIIVITLGCIAFEIWLDIEYGGKPITEIPAWVLWFWWRRG